MATAENEVRSHLGTKHQTNRLQTHLTLDHSALNNLSPAHRSVFEHLASTTPALLSQQNIHAGFVRFAEQQSHAIAVQHGNQSISYAELHHRSDQLADYLHANGIGIGDCVPLFLERSIEMIIGIIAILKAGAAYVPQHVGVAPQSQLRFVVDKTNAKIILSKDKFHSEVTELGCKHVVLIDKFQYSPSKSRSRIINQAQLDDRCIVLFTSGTTGTPNGVQVSHRNLCNILNTEPGNLGITPGTKVSQLLSISFDMAAWEILGCLSNGGTLIIREKDFQATASQADVIIATPTILSRIDVKACRARTVAVAGEPCPRSLADQWAQHCDFYNCCGPTETTIVNTMQLHHLDSDVLSIGKPTPNNTVYVLDENQQPCNIGDVGEMWAGGYCVTQGYLGNDNLTAERYRPDPFLGNDHVMFNTRDLGRWLPNGELEHHGRTDDQVKVRGFRVELDSVSAALESVASCTRASALKYDNQTLVGFVEPANVDTETAKAAVASKLPYYCIPEKVIALDSLPLTSRGKIDKRLLKETATEQFNAIHQSDNNNDTQAKNAPLDPQHKKAQALGLDIESYSTATLPPPSKSVSAKLTHHRFYHYWRLLALIGLVNIGFLLHGISTSWWSSNGINLAALSNLVVANITLAIVMRQQYVINLLFKIATRTPVTWPLRFRQLMGKVYHFGGLHLGGAIAGTLWMMVLLASIATQKLLDLPGQSASTATVIVSAQLAILLLVIVAMAMPSVRARFHNHFEVVHRFGGWTALVLFWLLTLLSINDQNTSQSLMAGMVSAAAFWCLVAVTISILLPWLRLKKVPVEIERPSDHVILARFDYGVTPFEGSATTISRNPLTEWHSFANVPEPGKDGYRLTISRAGDWTGRLIDDMPTHLWVKGIPTAGVGNVDKLFKRVVWVATGSGIGPTLPHLLARKVPAHLVWSTRNARKTYGDDLVDEILEVEPDALIWDTDERGRPDLVQLGYAAAKEFDAEAVIVIANEKLTRMVVHGMESRGIPAYGAIWDS